MAKKNRIKTIEHIVLNPNEVKTLLEAYKNGTGIKKLKEEDAISILQWIEKIVSNYAVLRSMLKGVATIVKNTGQPKIVVSQEFLKLELKTLMVERYQNFISIAHAVAKKGKKHA